MPATDRGKSSRWSSDDRQPVARRPAFVHAIDDLLDLVRVREVLRRVPDATGSPSRRTRRARAARAALRAAGRTRGSRARCSSTARCGRCAAITRRSPTTSSSASGRVARLGARPRPPRARRRRDRGCAAKAAAIAASRPSTVARRLPVRRGPAVACGTRPGRSPATRTARSATSVGQHADVVGAAERRVREVHDAQVGRGARAAAPGTSASW